MKHKALRFTDQREFEIICRQVQKQLTGQVEAIHGHFDTNRGGDIEITVWNDMAADYGFKAVMHVTAEHGYLLISDRGDADTVINDIQTERTGQPLDPIITRRLYENVLQQFNQKHGREAVVDFSALAPETAIPFKTVNEAQSVVTDMNSIYFLLVQGLAQI